MTDDIATQTRTAESWAAYGRFLAHAISTRKVEQIQQASQYLQYFRRSFSHVDLKIACAFHSTAGTVQSLWLEAQAALCAICALQDTDLFQVFLGGDLPGCAALALCAALGRKYIAFAQPSLTHETLELQPTFDEFLMSLGPNNRRHMRGRQKKALQANLQFEFTSDPGTVTPQELYALGAQSRPRSYPPAFIDECESLAQSRSRYIRCLLRTPAGTLLSTSTLFAEGDTAVMMYQLNDREHPELGLTMTLRGYMIQRCIELGLRRLVLPRGISGHLEHAASAYPIVQILFVRRSAAALFKAALMGLIHPKSIQASMLRAPGFLRAFLSETPSPPRPAA